MSGGGKGEVGAAGAAGTHSQATNPTAGENENRGQKVCVATNPHLAELARQYKPHLAQLARQYNPHLALEWTNKGSDPTTAPRTWTMQGRAHLMKSVKAHPARFLDGMERRRKIS